MSNTTKGRIGTSAALLLSLSLFGGTSVASESENNFSLITQNQYLGTSVQNLVRVFVSNANAATKNSALIVAIGQVKNSNTAERLFTQAETIIERMPHVVALQEVVKISCSSIDRDNSIAREFCADNFPQSTDLSQSIDHLDITMKVLETVGYNVAGIVENSKVSLPVSIDSDIYPDAMITLLDRDVLLTRADLVAEAVAFDCAPGLVSMNGCNYISGYSPLQPLLENSWIARGYVAIDFQLNQRKWRVINTHLEVQGQVPLVQILQAKELISIQPLDTDPDVTILTGDFNSPPESAFDTQDSPYKVLVESGFVDLWPLRPGRSPGYTCCQNPDLLNAESQLDRRIDHVFASGSISRVKANVLNNTPLDKTQTNPMLWPSDHAGVYVELREKHRSRTTGHSRRQVH